MVVSAAVAGGGLLTAAATRLGGRGLGALVAAAALAMAAGALAGVPAGLAAVAAAFGIFQMVTVVADTRLQNQITGPGRATVTSVAAMGTEALTILVYLAYAPLGTPAVAFAVLAMPYLIVAAALVRTARSGARE